MTGPEARPAAGPPPDLVARAAAGDSRAFGDLIRGLEPDLRNVLRGILRTAPDVDVEDVLQEVRVYLFQRLDRYDPAYPVGAFARGLARNVAKRAIHRRRDLLPPVSGGDEDDGDDRSDLSPMELGRLPVAFREVMGEGRFAEPGEETGPSRTFLEMLEVFLRYGGYPHQQVTFGFGILLWGRAKRRTGAGGKAPAEGGARGEKVPVTGDPDRVVREVGPEELSPAAERMLDDLGAECRLEASFLDRARGPLDERLEMTGRALFARDPASAQRYADLAARVIGGTRLEEYFGGDARRSVSDWTHGVKARVRKAFLEPEARSRFPLPEPAGAPARAPAGGRGPAGDEGPRGEGPREV
jgi:RNA polymerase sigma factor (sigma-70 family)